MFVIYDQVSRPNWQKSIKLMIGIQDHFRIWKGGPYRERSLVFQRGPYRGGPYKEGGLYYYYWSINTLKSNVSTTQWI